MRILVIEDNSDIAANIGDYLEDKGHVVDFAGDGVTGLHLAVVHEFDAIVLDLTLPGMDGLELCRKLRQEARRQTPVLMLTARDALDQKLTGFDSGADDYMVKPFALAELLSRVRALLRRSYGFEGDTIELRGLALHEPTRQVSVRGNPVELSRSEYELLAALLKRAGRVITRHTLEEQVLPGQIGSESNVLDVHMSNLRRKIGEGYIRNVRGVGYVIDQVVRDKAGGP